jgi:pyruvate,orthophosphate dikinase
MNKRVYFFGGGVADGNAEMKNLLGGKGANLAEMCRLGIPVPAGFTITTEVCAEFYNNGESLPADLDAETWKNMQRVESVMGARFGDAENPLLVSVRSGARSSMPGMMDTTLNLGLNDDIAAAVARNSGDEHFVWDAYRRFVSMYAEVVYGIGKEGEHSAFERMLADKKKQKGVDSDVDLDAETLKELVVEFKAYFEKATGHSFPDDPRAQLFAAIGAVFRSWNNDRAKAYRAMYDVPDDWGTAVNVQSMVFGNLGDDCATGVAFTRNPASGDRQLFGEFLVNAQGEDVVAGTRTPQPVSAASRNQTSTMSMQEWKPEVYESLVNVCAKLEKHFRDMQDTEFTVQRGKLWMLQTRNGKRTGFAAVRIAIDMVEEGLIDERSAVMRIDPEAVTHLLRPVFNADDKARALKEGRALATGLPAGPGAAAGKIALTAASAAEMAKTGEKVVLVRHETSPDDIRGMQVSEGVLTARGGMTSHAAVVGRQMGKVCVVGCGGIEVDYQKRQIHAKGKTFAEGDWLSLDGFEGVVIEGPVETTPSEVLQVLFEGRNPEDASIYQRYQKLMRWADEMRRLEVRSNADQKDQALTAMKLGAEGIGLCRTEHMFFGEDRIELMREMILAEDKAGRERALNKLLPIQRVDFEELFEEMAGYPVTIRTLDPPLHEFLPRSDAEIEALARSMDVPFEQLRIKVDALREANPMLGHRGCRLGISYPEITAMQARAIIEAAVNVNRRGGDARPEIMIPLIAFESELTNQVEVVNAEVAKVFEEQQQKIDYMVGTMIELPRAALIADRIAEVAEFFSFGTNDLTQTTLGISRDDTGPMLRHYQDIGILDNDPFQTLDQTGVGRLIEIGVEKGRAARNHLEIGICGEHGGDPKSVAFCHRAGLDYVSCSPFRIPVARLAAAQAAGAD